MAKTPAGGRRSFGMDRHPGFVIASMPTVPSRRSELCYTPLSLETRIRLARQRQAVKAQHPVDHDKENVSQHRNTSAVVKGQQRSKSGALPLQQKVRPTFFPSPSGSWSLHDQNLTSAGEQPSFTYFYAGV